MRVCNRIDENGYKRQVILRNDDDDFINGIPLEPPPVELLPIDDMLRDLHNQLMDRKIYSKNDLEKGGLRGAILSAFKKYLITLYKGGYDG